MSGFDLLLAVTGGVYLGAIFWLLLPETVQSMISMMIMMGMMMGVMMVMRWITK